MGCINYDTREEEIKKAFVTFGPIRCVGGRSLEDGDQKPDDDEVMMPILLILRSITMSWDSMTGKHKVINDHPLHQ